MLPVHKPVQLSAPLALSVFQFVPHRSETEGLKPGHRVYICFSNYFCHYICLSNYLLIIRESLVCLSFGFVCIISNHFFLSNSWSFIYKSQKQTVKSTQISTNTEDRKCLLSDYSIVKLIYSRVLTPSTWLGLGTLTLHSPTPPYFTDCKLQCFIHLEN